MCFEMDGPQSISKIGTGTLEMHFWKCTGKFSKKGMLIQKYIPIFFWRSEVLNILFDYVKKKFYNKISLLDLVGL